MAEPRLFIGSSGEALDIARAIRASLDKGIECTLWENSFTLSTTNIESLVENVKTNDFAAFVFSPDDVVEKRGHHYLVARDNVLYELGLFTGGLGRDRCFFVLPDQPTVTLPTDLAGVGHGWYKTTRSDKNIREAVSSFCTLVRESVDLLGPIPRALPRELIQLAVQFECAEWIQPREKDQAVDDRVNKKKEINKLMIEGLRKAPINKLNLTKDQTPGFWMLLCSAIWIDPQLGDENLILSIPPDKIPRGVVQAAVVSVVRGLEKAGKITAAGRQRLFVWTDKFQDVDDSLKNQLKTLRDTLR
jgi:hypothetical protein